VNDRQKEPKVKSKQPGLVIKLSAVFLLLINIYLAYNLTSNVVGAFNNKDEEIKIDSSAAPLQLEVLNGCGISGKADLLTNYLRKNGFDVVNIGNYRSFDLENSIVIDRTGKIQNAERVAESIGLGNENVIQQINKDYLLDVTVILGKDYSKLIPLKKRI